MRVHRGSLFWGLFFLLLGGIPLADRTGLIDASALGGFGRLWPLAIIAAGVAILVSRTRFAILGTVLAAAVVGTLAGGAIAGAGSMVISGDTCFPAGSQALTRETKSGMLASGASAVFSLNCGTLDVTTQAGDGWSVGAAYRGSPPVVSAGGTRLEVTTPRGGTQGQDWKVVLPRDQVTSVEASVNAGNATLDLAGSHLAGLRLDVNAGNLILLANGATISRLDAKANAGRVALTLAGPVDGAVGANAGGIDLCVPSDVQLQFRITQESLSGTNLAERGLSRSGDVWTRSGSGPLIRLDVSVNLGGFNLDPTGGCR